LKNVKTRKERKQGWDCHKKKKKKKENQNFVALRNLHMRQGGEKQGNRRPQLGGTVRKKGGGQKKTKDDRSPSQRSNCTEGNSRVKSQFLGLNNSEKRQKD